MGYPNSWRRAARKYGGGSFQDPAPATPVNPYRNPMRPPYKDPPKPDNDPWPVPANDNKPGGGQKEYPPFPKLPPFPGLPEAAAGAAGRFIPRQYRFLFDVLKYPWDYYANRRKYPDNTADISAQLSHSCGPVFPTNPPYFVGKYGWHIIGTGKQCGLAGQALGDGSAVVVDVPPNRGLTFAQQRPDRGTWAVIEQWWNATGATVKVSFMHPMTGPAPIIAVPNPVPATVANPVPAYVPAPVGNVVPDLAPLPAATPRARYAYYYAYKPAGRNLPDHWPQPSPNPGPVVIVAPPTVINPVRKPPGPGVKERKIRVSGALAGALGAAAGVYEDTKFYNDVLNAWYYSLPGPHKARTPAEKALELYRRAEEIDVNKAIRNVLWAVAYEKGGAYIDRARRKAGDNLGLNMYISIPTGSAPRI